MSTLLPYQQRVVDEKRDLDSKIKLLSDFLSTDTYLALPGIERADLIEQRTHMMNYSNSLMSRISRFIPPGTHL